MRAWIYPYALQSKGALNSKATQRLHEGCLLKFEFQNEVYGYSDCHPWPELGDLPLSFHLKLLRSGHWTRAMQQSYKIAAHDSQCREQGVSLFQHLSIPESHALVTDLKGLTEDSLSNLEQTGFTRIKVKASKESAPSIKAVLKHLQPSKIKLRLDFNESLTAGEFHNFLKGIQDHLPQIEFIEDPIPFHMTYWQKFQSEYRVPLACDRSSMRAIGYAESAQYLVVKPAIQDLENYRNAPQTIIITTYADHPVGQMSAAWVAANFKGRLGVCGLLSHYAYESNPFSGLIRHTGPYMQPPAGTGLGFNALLEKLPWETIL